ncbi:MAG: ABC transporter permease [Candidatus Brocadiaceae bacterium]|jgi:phospholipid/cholesterol/gamma-HCH transport system permease protein
MAGFVEQARSFCCAAYDVGALTLNSVRHLGEAVRRHRLLARQCYEVGNRSLLIVTVFGVFVGLILVLYGGDQLQRFGQQKFIGLTGLAIVWEFGPVFTAFILAGRIGSAYAAEIGTMKVYEEIDALSSMGVSPVAYLVSPRFFACSTLTPALVVYADFCALLGGAFMAWTYVRVAPNQFFQLFFQYLTVKEMLRSLVKSLAFGGIIAITGCYHGFKTTGGAEGVGRSTTQSVVHSLLAILIADYFISKVLVAI